MSLSRRESQVVELMGKGLSRAEISNRLGVSRKCVSVFIERARGVGGSYNSTDFGDNVQDQRIRSAKDTLLSSRPLSSINRAAFLIVFFRREKM